MASSGPAAGRAAPLLVVGASAGGVESLRDLVGSLPVDFPACVLVVLHVPATGTSVLPAILDRAGPLPARHASDGDRLAPATVLVAPPDRHLIVAGDRVTLSRGPQENGHRPAVDVLFRSAARSQGRRVVAVVLSGSLDDGAAGMVAVARRGGVGVVQDFDEAMYDAMPRAAQRAADVDHVVPLAEMPALLTRLVGEAATCPQPDEPPAQMDLESDVADLDPGAMHHHDRPGEPAGFGCPDCGGALFGIEEGRLLRFRCRVGHAWSSDSLLARQTVALEGALWMALRSLEERAALSRDLGDRAGEAGHKGAADRFADRAHETMRSAELLRGLVADIGGMIGDDVARTDDGVDTDGEALPGPAA